MKYLENIDLFPYHTFSIHVMARQLILIEDATEIESLFAQNVFSEPFMIIGGGSNLLFTHNFEGTLLKMATKGIRKIKEDDDTVFVAVEAGELWEDFITYCIQNQYYGAENLIGIPGLVGSAPVQNIGAYSVEANDIIHQVAGWKISSQTPFLFSNSDCQFGYRQSIFKTQLKNDCLITKVIFKLSKKERYVIAYQGLIEALAQDNTPLSLSKVATAITQIRTQKLPDISKIGCAGSFFKNPVISTDQFNHLHSIFQQLISYEVDKNHRKLAAGQLIDIAGLKGWRSGSLGVWEKQALVIVNYGGATGQEVVDFYQQIAQRVLELFDIQLEPEVNII